MARNNRLAGLRAVCPVMHGHLSHSPSCHARTPVEPWRHAVTPFKGQRRVVWIRPVRSTRVLHRFKQHTWDNPCYWCSLTGSLAVHLGHHCRVQTSEGSGHADPVKANSKAIRMRCGFQTFRRPIHNKTSTPTTYYSKHPNIKIKKEEKRATMHNNVFQPLESQTTTAPEHLPPQTKFGVRLCFNRCLSAHRGHGVCLQGGLPMGDLHRGSLHPRGLPREVCIWGDWTDLPYPELEKQAVRILLECFLVQFVTLRCSVQEGPGPVFIFIPLDSRTSENKKVGNKDMIFMLMHWLQEWSLWRHA